MAHRKITTEEQELREKANRFLPGGTVGNIKSVMIREGRGGRVWDVSGNEYVDFMLAAGPMLLGHAHSEVVEAADALYAKLLDDGVQVLYDDRDESPGVKFNDSDLLGLPLRLVVSPRNLRQGVVEVKARSESEATTVPSDQVVERVRELLSD